MKQLKNFSEVRELLSHHVPQTSLRGAYTLERMQSLMDKLGNPQDKYKVVHVAGTSGKTSTSYFIAAMLKTSGMKVGLTVSPHIDEVNERVQINLEPLGEKKFCRQFSILIEEVARTGIKPTYFELLVAFAYWQFAKEKVDYAVVEVGLGGLLDGTNVTSRADKICIITDIGMDHTSVLGETLTAITAQKAGIIKPHNPVFIYEQDDEVMSVLREVCEQLQAELHEIWPLKSSELPSNLPLFQRRNWYLALMVYDFVSKRDSLPELDENDLADTTATYIPARMETLKREGKIIIMDGAHNAQKMDALVDSVKNAHKGQEIVVLFSLLQSRKARAVPTIRKLFSLCNHVILTNFETEQDLRKQSMPAVRVAEICDELGFDNWEIIDNAEVALKYVLKRPEPVIVVTGSFYLLNRIRPLLLSDDKTHSRD